MNDVRVARKLFWRGAAPVLPSGALDTEALARALSRAHYGATRRFYSRAQHAAVLSRAVESVAKFDEARRRVVAMQAWLADMRAAWLTGKGAKPLGGLGNVALRTLDVETLANMFAGVCRWDEAPDTDGVSVNGTRGGSARGDLPPRGAAEFEARLKRLAKFDPEDRRRLALYALLGEAVTAGLGADDGEAVLEAAGLDPRIPNAWAESLGVVWRMTETAVRRDVGNGGSARPAFPAPKNRIEPLGPEAAAECWLRRYRSLTASGPADGTSARGSSARSDPAGDGPAHGTSGTRGAETTDSGDKR